MTLWEFSFCRLSTSARRYNSSKPLKPAWLLISSRRCFASFRPEWAYRLEKSQAFEECDTKQQRSAELGLLAGFHIAGSLTDPYFINKAVSFCAKSASFLAGIQLHSPIVKLGFTSNVCVSSAVVYMYSKCGDIQSAQKIFDEMPARNVVTWNSLISGYLDANFSKVAVQLFVEMLRQENSVTPFSLSSCLVSCSQLEDRDLGEQLHSISLKAGFGSHVVVGTGLIDMYSKSCSVGLSKLVFDRIVDKNLITWTSMVTAYSQNEEPCEAMMLVREMMQLGLKLNGVTFNSLLSSFSTPDHLECCKQVHCCIIRQGLESNEYITATLVTVYSKCSRSLEEFVKACSGVAIWDQVSWNAVIAGYCNLECEKEAFRCFCEMRQAGTDGDFYTFTSLVGVIGSSSFLEEGREVHALISKTRYASSLHVQNGLVSMYARCGAIDESKRIFWSMPKHDVVSWNSLLTACAHHGYGKEAVELFEEMRKSKTKPDATTFLVVLSACSHVGFVDQGLEYFDLLKSDVSVGPPTLEHYANVVDIFGRAGYIKEAETFVSNIPLKPGSTVYKALLSASLVHECREWLLETRTSRGSKVKESSNSERTPTGKSSPSPGCATPSASGLRRSERSLKKDTTPSLPNVNICILEILFWKTITDEDNSLSKRKINEANLDAADAMVSNKDASISLSVAVSLQDHSQENCTLDTCARGIKRQRSNVLLGDALLLSVGFVLEYGSLAKVSCLPAGLGPGLDYHHLDAVNNLSGYWHKGTNAVILDEQFELDANHNKILLNRILAEAFRSKFMDIRACNSPGVMQCRCCFHFHAAIATDGFTAYARMLRTLIFCCSFSPFDAGWGPNWRYSADCQCFTFSFHNHHL
ncbi:unnamed protein product [Linum tenue]|uniref:Pentatricopeptide repeat-containing protein n=1 Tax=Linum tenue TaxID=586396 RepID=A0AAV0N2S7_9ROSI|nr:unnamed protein product [Linum tenue]